MKYMLMVLGKQADYDAMGGTANSDGPGWSEADLKAMFDYMGALNDDLAESGEWVDGQGLAHPRHARLVTAAADGSPVISDGPYGEAKEVLAGYWIVDVADFDRAAEIAARAYACPVPEGAPNYPVVVHPVDSRSGTEMC
ncbi:MULTISPECIES: YciI family protein [unclassified Streptomyces]|uniref:YciI family protein n=1 Tax=unclassified Streptomyces TaxID=2593676 RepID=UPI002E28DF4B|nr:YciI family protein [Streptomyces sp. NBC_01439]